ncbi:MAG: hypothetical protein HQ582_24750 [Planctomycetes bacterium]|nr:hypothetical protein [Planctomycetota bacterium]
MIEDAASQIAEEPPATTVVPARPRLLPLVAQVAGITVLLGGALVGYARWRTGSMELVWPYLGGQRLLFEPTQLVLGEVAKGKVVEREVRVVNLSSGELRLLGSQNSCGRIALDEFPIVIPAGEDRHLHLKISMPRRTASFEHSIKFFSDDPGHLSAVVTVSGCVP